uniref:Uncharacterized protein n=1 Tax=Cacopsylla melanoneura TaxID=428564 RepID=A0A8D9EZI9_9HEMI
MRLHILEPKGIIIYRGCTHSTHEVWFDGRHYSPRNHKHVIYTPCLSEHTTYKLILSRGVQTLTAYSIIDTNLLLDCTVFHVILDTHCCQLILFCLHFNKHKLPQ